MRNEKYIAKTHTRAHGRITLITFVVLLSLILLVFGIMILPYSLALAAGLMLALLTFPLHRMLIHFRNYPRIASGILTIGIIILAVIPMSIFLYLAIKQGIDLTRTLIQNKEFSAYGIFNRISEWGFIKRGFDSGLKEQMFEWIQQAGSAIMAALIAIITNIPNLLLQVALTLISYFYFLIDGPKFITWLYDRVPLDIDVRKKIVNTFRDTTITVIWATLAAATVQSLIMFVAFLALSVPGVFLATTATFIFAWIPILGSTPVWLLGALYLYSQDLLLKALLMILFGFFTGISDNYVRPWVLKGRANMHPVVSLIAIFGGISLFGILGVFIGPVIAAILISLLQIWPVIGQQFGFLSSEKS